MRIVVMSVFVIIGLFVSEQTNAQLLPTYIRGAFTLGETSSAYSPYDLNDTFFLETNPGASKTIYLDFDGHHSFDNQWGHDLVFDSFNRSGGVDTFTNSELREIQLQFQNVAEDFMPFDVNVTTRDPGRDALVRSNADDTTYGIRMVNTQNISGSGAGGGGTAYVNSFNWVDDRDNVAFAFNKGENIGGMTNSHEIGHTLGLSHDGLGSQTYHPGTGGSAETSWGPIMGAPFSANLTQWSNGDYTDSTTTQDDLAIITKTANGINYKVDTVGETISSSALLSLDSNGSVFNWNIIEQNTDVDMFSFFTGEGQVSLFVNPFQGRANLDILANLYDASGSLLMSSNPLDELGAAFDLVLDSGQYFISIEGTGRAGRYSDYGSLGLYTIEGFVVAVPEPASTLIGLAGIAIVLRRKRRFHR